MNIMNIVTFDQQDDQAELPPTHQSPNSPLSSSLVFDFLSSHMKSIKEVRNLTKSEHFAWALVQTRHNIPRGVEHQHSRVARCKK
jgi:hypothetical protein